MDFFVDLPLRLGNALVYRDDVLFERIKSRFYGCVRTDTGYAMCTHLIAHKCYLSSARCENDIATDKWKPQQPRLRFVEDGRVAK